MGTEKQRLLKLYNYELYKTQVEGKNGSTLLSKYRKALSRMNKKSTD